MNELLRAAGDWEECAGVGGMQWKEIMKDHVRASRASG